MAYRIIDRELERCQDWLGDRTDGIGYNIVQAIGLERDGNLVAVAGYNQFVERSCQVHFAIEQGAYPTRSFIWFVHYYPFIQAGVDVMLAIVSLTNEKINRLAQHLGYERRAYLDDAGLMLYSMHKDNCRFIGADYGRG